MIRQLAGAQAKVAGVVLPVDEVDAVPDKVLGKLGHQHLIAALIVPVRLFDVGEQGVPHDFPQGEAHDVVLHLEDAPQQVIGGEVVQHLVGLGDVLVEGGGGLVPPGGITIQKRLHLGDVFLGHGTEGPAAIGL